MADFIPSPSPSARYSPFRPGFGATPPALVGRQSHINAFARSLDGPPGSPGRAAFVTGQRGVGKTVMLNVFEDIAESRQWLHVREQASPGFADRLAHARIPEVLEAHDAHDNVKSRIVGANVLGVGVTARSESTSTLRPDFRSHLMKTLDLLNEHGTGLLIALDEVHRTNLDEFRAITDAVAYAFSQDSPLAIVVAGLPSSINDIVNDEVSTFLRRADRIALGDLTPDQAAVGLAEPIAQAGKQITDKALTAAVDLAEGYPYLVQVVGNLSWIASGDEAVITTDHVSSAIAETKSVLDQQIHVPTIAALSDGQRGYLDAMSLDAGASRTRDLADRLNVSKQAGNRLREQLINLGIIEAPIRGQVDFAIPYMRDHLIARADELTAEIDAVHTPHKMAPGNESRRVVDAQAADSISRVVKNRPSTGIAVSGANAAPSRAKTQDPPQQQARERGAGQSE